MSLKDKAELFIREKPEQEIVPSNTFGGYAVAFLAACAYCLDHARATHYCTLCDCPLCEKHAKTHPQGWVKENGGMK